MTDTPHRAAVGATSQPNATGFTLLLEDGRTLWVPWEVSFTLSRASSAERVDTCISPDRTTIHWPMLRFSERIAHLAELAVASLSAQVEHSPRLIDAPDIWRDAR